MRNLRFRFSSLAVSLRSAAATATLGLAVGALGLAGGCSSADTKAAKFAAEAQADLDQGRTFEAAKAIRKALAARDDVIDNWLLKAHIDLKAGDRGSAFGDYEFVLQLDHTNMEALQQLCHLGLTVGEPDTVDKYADQLLLLAPGAAIALTAKGSVALSRQDPDTAEKFADRVLTQDPQDLPALTLKSRVMMQRGRFADAASLIEKTSDMGGSPISKLRLLVNVYTDANNRPAYEQTVRRLAAAAPDDADVQLKFADMLYQEGQFDPARQAIGRVLAANGTNLQVAADALNILIQAGPQALDPGRMVGDAAHLSLVMKADYAQFANETGHPDIAIAILQGADQGQPTPENSNAKAALAYALGMTGRRPQAMAQLNAILDDAHDPNQPWALLARARLQAISHDYVNAVRDARLVVANDPNNATAHLALADILKASGKADLGESALREGLRAIPNSTLLAGRLAATLAARGDRDQAEQVARDLVRTASMDQRAAALLHFYAPGSTGAATS